MVFVLWCRRLAAQIVPGGLPELVTAVFASFSDAVGRALWPTLLFLASRVGTSERGLLVGFAHGCGVLATKAVLCVDTAFHFGPVSPGPH